MKDYQAEWKVIDSLERQGLPQSALTEVNKLYELAKAETNSPQIIKALVYSNKYQIQLEEDGFVRAIERMQVEMEQAAFPMKPILQSMIAQMYQNYLMSNRWNLQNRTTTTGIVPEDIKTWTIDQLADKAAELYWMSLENEQELLTIPVTDYAAITLNPNSNNDDVIENTDRFRPSLFDLLAHRAIDHFKNDQTYLNRPADQFYIDDKAVFWDAKAFAEYTFTTTDTTSGKYKTLLLFQSLIRLHLNDDQPDALLDVDLARLQFAYSNAVMERGDEHYLAALQRIHDQYKNNDLAAEANYYIASLYQNQGIQYKPSYLDEVIPPDEKAKWGYKRAVELCEQTIKDFPDTRGAKLCSNLKNTVLATSLSFQLEQVNVPNQAILSLVEYRNLKKIYFKIVKVSERDYYSHEYGNRQDWPEFLRGAEAYRKMEEELPATEDFHQHSIEVIMENLPLGLYGILISSDPNFSEKSQTGHAITQISNIAFLKRDQQNEIPEFVVMDRTSGAPMSGVKAEFFRVNYRNRNKYRIADVGEALTDQNGFVKPANFDNNLNVKFSKGEDRFILSENASSYKYDRQRTSNITKLFTDRSIYRPGQTVYFKALLYQVNSEDELPKIVPNQEVTITFKDVNYQDISQQVLVTNEYGTVQGSFTAPTKGLLGRMSINSSFGRQNAIVRVEEYKRPKFEVKMLPFEEEYALEDTVTVEGHALGFAGNNIDGAKVTYRVERTVRYPWWPYYFYFRYPSQNGSSATIANGEVATGADGKFKIEFPAIPDYSTKQSDQPMFIYNVYADVVDITGETHSANKSISLAYIGLQAKLEVPKEYDRTRPFSVEVGITNLDGQAIEEDCIFTVEKLKRVDQVFVDRYWQQPDLYKYNEATYREKLPHFAYKLENQTAFLPTEVEVYQDSFNTKNKILFTIPSSAQWETGTYKATLIANDENGNEVKREQIFIVYDSRSNQIPKALLFKTDAKNVTPLDEYEPGKYNPKLYEPGDQALVKFIAGGDLTTHLLFELERRGKRLDRTWKNFRSFEQYTYKVTEEDRGNLNYHTAFVKYNRAYTNAYTLEVPWTNKQLKVEFATFRDKLRPGQEEEWQVKISGTQKDQVAAEFLATMYDASLDQFAYHNWYFSPYPVNNYTPVNWRKNYFRPISAYIYRYVNYPDRTYNTTRDYRYLNWFGLLYDGRGYGRGRLENYSARQLGGVMTRAPEVVQDMVMEESEAVVAMAMPSEAKAAAFEDAPPPPSPETEANSGEEQAQPAELQIRTNLNETVFFFPDLKTDEEGNIILDFTMNEALTRWKFLGFAHTKDLATGMLSKEVVTQKELMVLPNPPRFMREGDEITFTAKVNNLTDTVMNGSAELLLFDALTMEPVNELFAHQETSLPFTAEAQQSAALAWTLKVPVGKVPALTHRVIAKSGDFSDGEESSLPIVSNRMMVTESIPLSVRGKATKTVTFESLAKANESSSLKHHNLSLEFSSNPAWYAVQALPYLMEFPYECTEQIFNRLYANSLAASVVDQHPNIQDMFDQWRDTDALLSNLQKNEALKTALLEETPWVLEAESEEQQKKNIGLLFDMNRMSKEKEDIVAQLEERQSGTGGFPWFPGGRDSWYITQYLVEGFGHLERLGIGATQSDDGATQMITKAVQFIDGEMKEHYRELERSVKKGFTKWEDNHLSALIVHYLYARSFYFDQVAMDNQNQKIFTYYIDQTKKYWLQQGLYEQALIGLAADRRGEPKLSQMIIRSLKERALRNEELGMYWKYNRGYYWNQLPIETHTALLELFAEVAKDEEVVNELKVWLLKNKQTNNWKTTKATAAAVYALFSYGDNWLDTS